MKTHANARLSLKGRELLIERVKRAGWSLSAAAEAAGISDRTARATGPRGPRAVGSLLRAGGGR
jgi:leucine-zipper of insertion element IS481